MRGIALCVLVGAACGSVSSKNPGDANGDGRRSGGDGTGPFFETPMGCNRDVSGSTKSSKSDAMSAALRTEGGWGNGDKMQIDFTISVLTANASTPMKTFTPTADFYTPDCDHVAMPVPA